MIQRDLKKNSRWGYDLKERATMKNQNNRNLIKLNGNTLIISTFNARYKFNIF